MAKITKGYICDGIAKSLVEFGYPDVTPAMVATIYDEFKAGKRFPDLSHGIVGGFAERQLSDVQDVLGQLPAA